MIKLHWHFILIYPTKTFLFVACLPTRIYSISTHCPIFCFMALRQYFSMAPLNSKAPTAWLNPHGSNKVANKC
ncbi:hypothetical protein V6Z11_A11G123200 [Gossypium hirsutum]